MKKVHTGGRGKQDELRNKAIVTLNKVEPEIFSSYALAELFERSRRTIRQVLDRENASKS